jgi:hypothetical protein
MTATSIGRVVIPFLALVAACGAALVFGITHVQREPPLRPPRRLFRPLRPAIETKARLRSQRQKLKQTPWRLYLPYRRARRTPMSPCPSSTLPALSKRVTPSSPAGLRRAPSWNCCATARAMIERSQIKPDNSSWFLPGFPPGDYELTLRSRQPDGEQATSKQSMVVVLTGVESSSGVANLSVLDQTVGCVYRKSKSERIDDEVHPVWRANL